MASSLLGINFRFQSSSLNSVARCKTNRTTRRHSYAAAGQCLNSQVSVVMESSSFHWSLDSDSWTNVQLPISYSLKFHSCLRFPLIRYCFASCSLELATVTVGRMSGSVQVVPKFDRCRDTEVVEEGPTDRRSQLPRSRTPRTRHSHATANPPTCTHPPSKLNKPRMPNLSSGY